MIKLITLLAPLIALNSFAQIGTLTVDFRSTESKAAYQKQDSNSQVYTQVSAKIVTYSKMTGTEDLAEVSTAETETISTTVPGVDATGYSRLTIVKESNDKIYLTYDSSTIDPNTKIEIVKNYRAEIALVEGTWQDFTSGKTVEFTYTEAGKKELLDTHTAQLKSTMNRFRDYLLQSAEGINAEVVLNKIESKSKTRIRANSERVDIVSNGDDFISISIITTEKDE